MAADTGSDHVVAGHPGQHTNGYSARPSQPTKYTALSFHLDVSTTISAFDRRQTNIKHAVTLTECTRWVTSCIEAQELGIRDRQTVHSAQGADRVRTPLGYHHTHLAARR
jgi:hypothetical protein